MTAQSESDANRKAMEDLVGQLREKLTMLKQGGGKAALERHRGRGKMFVRDRIEALVDPGTPFLEFSALAANDMYGGAAPSAGIVTGIGTIQGRTRLSSSPTMRQSRAERTSR